MPTLSYVQKNSGGTQYEFSYFSGSFKQAIVQEASFIADRPDGVTTVNNVPGMVRKSIDLTILFHTVSGGSTAVQKYFSFLNFVRQNTAVQMKLHLELDGGSTTKDYVGKFVAEQVGTITGQSPEEVMTTFQFIIEGSSW